MSLTKKTNAYLANIAVEYTKLHNLHWNVVGPEFKQVHEYLEGLYDAFADEMDTVAEVLRQDGELPVSSMKEQLALATIQEREDAEVSIPEVLKTVKADIELLRAQALELRSAASEEDHFVLSNLMEDHVTEYNKTLWFVDAMLK